MCGGDMEMNAKDATVEKPYSTKILALGLAVLPGFE
jgi:hypothetical protein